MVEDDTREMMTTSIENTTITSSPIDTTTAPVTKKPTRPLTAYHLFFQLERGERDI